MDITVVTPSIPDRHYYLYEAQQSVQAQTLPPAAHLIGIDYARRGPSLVRNELIRSVETEWTAFLDDDDLLDPDHLETLWEGRGTASVVYSYCRFSGEPLPDQYVNNLFDRDKLKLHGIFPITVLAKTDALIKGGLFKQKDRYEDWSLWNRIADRGLKFKGIPKVTWTYRTDSPNRRTHDE